MEGGINRSLTILETSVDGDPTLRRFLLNFTDSIKGAKSVQKFKANHIRTAKYSVFTFIPLNLITQFSKTANLYFALISFLQTIKPISITGGSPVQLAPLSAVVIASMVKDGFEDYKRHKTDKEENTKIAHVYDIAQGKFVEKEWADIKAGQIIKITDEEPIPCDMVLLKSSDPKGGLYIETKNLDGETNLKNKTVQKEINEMMQDMDWKKLNDAKIVCEKPNNAIYKFEGRIDIQNQKIGLDTENLILRGCTLRNT